MPPSPAARPEVPTLPCARGARLSPPSPARLLPPPGPPNRRQALHAAPARKQQGLHHATNRPRQGDRPCKASQGSLVHAGDRGFEHAVRQSGTLWDVRVSLLAVDDLCPPRAAQRRHRIAATLTTAVAPLSTWLPASLDLIDRTPSQTSETQP